MIVCDWCKINELAVAQVGKSAVFIANHGPSDDVWQFVIKSMQTIYGDATPEFHQVMSHIVNGGLFFFDTKEEQMTFYRVFEQPLTDSSAIYACTYDASGQCMTENT